MYRARTAGDFGYDSQLGIDWKVEVEYTRSPLQTFSVFRPFKDGARVVVTRDDGTKEGFTFRPWVEYRYLGLVEVWHPAFVSDEGVTSRLSVPDVELMQVGDEYISLEAGGVSYNPLDPAFGNVFYHFARDHFKRTLDAATGELLSIADRNGNALEIANDAITHTSGRKIDIVHDGFGRIRRIEDPRGNSIVYDYSTGGDLVAVTDRAGNITRFDYRTDFPHYVASITDPLGRKSVTAGYDSAGRLASLTDAAGKTVSMTYDLSNPQAPVQQIADQLSGSEQGTTTITFDARGNISQLVDASGEVTTAAYDVADRPRTETRVIGQPDSPTNGETDDIATTTDYDPALGTVVRRTDALGNVTRYTYNKAGQVESITDALGNSTWFTYDYFGDFTTGPSSDADYFGGNLTMTTGALGNSTGFRYDEHGNVEQVTSGLGFSNFLHEGMVYDENYWPTGATSDPYYPPASPSEPAPLVSTRFEYNEFGDLEASIDTNENRRDLMPNANGAQEGSTFVWTNPNPPYDERTVTTASVYNGNDQLTDSTGPDGTTHTDYDALGRAVRTTDRFGATSETLYDARGLVIETRSQTTPDALGNPQWLVTRTVYDAKGRAVWTVDSSPLVGEGQGGGSLGQGTFTASGTYTVYDSLDRVRESRRYENVRIDVVQDPNNPGALMTLLVTPDLSQPEAPTPVSSTSTDYDSAGRVEHTTNADGLVTRYEYDKAGRQKAVIIVVTVPVYSEYRTTYEYDAAGRQVSVTDAMNRTTRYQYDAAGNVIRTIFPSPSGEGQGEGPVTSTTYDTQGRRIAETDALGRTTNYEYDPRGNLKAVILPEVPDPEDLDANGDPILKQARYDYEYDVYGNHVLIRDPKGRETRFTYDELGRQRTRTLPEFIDPTTGQPRTVTETTDYDDSGRIERKTDFAGQVTEYVYTDQPDRTDVLGRVLFVNYYQVGSTTPDETWSYSYDLYDEQGFRHDSITQTIGTQSYTTEHVYDREGRLVQIVSPEGTLNYDYDPATGRRIRTYTDSTDVQYGYDQLGRLTTVTQVMRNGETLTIPEVTRYEYDPLGNLLRTDLPNGVASIYDYDALNRLEKLTHGIPSAVDPDVFDTVLAEFDYDLGPDGKREALTERIRLDDGSYRTETIDWAYDAIGRLTSEHHDSSAAGEDFAIDYVYDLVGNRLEKTTETLDDAGVVVRSERTDYAYNALDQLLGEAEFIDGLLDRTTLYGYDTNGAQTSKVVYQGDQTGPVIESATYDYDLQGWLSSATIDRTENGQPVHIEAAYRYNPDGIRVASDTTTAIDNGTPTVEQKLFLIDSNNPTGYAQVLEEWLVDSANPTVRTLALSYLIGLDVLSQASALFAPSAVRLILADGLGSTRLLTDPAAAITDRYYYDAYGNLLQQPIGASSLAATSLLYTGEQFEPNLLSYYLRARFYDPATGRFSRLDPFAGFIGTPLTLHKYLYSSADPVLFVDPSGEFSAVGSISVSATIGALVGMTYGAVTGYQKTGTLRGTIAYGLLGTLAGGAIGAAAGFLGYQIVTLLSNAAGPSTIGRIITDLVVQRHSSRAWVFLAGTALGLYLGVRQPEGLNSTRLVTAIATGEIASSLGFVGIELLKRHHEQLPHWLKQVLLTKLFKNWKGRWVKIGGVARGPAFWGVWFFAGMGAGYAAGVSTRLLTDYLIDLAMEPMKEKILAASES